MGIKYLTYNHQNIDARVPFETTASSMVEIDAGVTGDLKSIGIDGSIFFHAYYRTYIDPYESDREEASMIHNVKYISDIIKGYILRILHYFGKSCGDPVIIYLVMDDAPPVKKNRNISKTQSAYSQVPKPNRKNLLNLIYKALHDEYNGGNTRVLTNLNRKSKEGEIELYSFTRRIRSSSFNTRHVIVSCDSDLVAMMIFHTDPSLVIISPICGNAYILNYNMVKSGLSLSDYQLQMYTLLHFIFFGSDYNVGMVMASKNKHDIILDSVKKGVTDVNQIGNQFTRKKSAEAEKETPEYLENLKKELMHEAVCAAKYYASLGNETYLKNSPLLYLDTSFNYSQHLPQISFAEKNNVNINPLTC